MNSIHSSKLSFQTSFTWANAMMDIETIFFFFLKKVGFTQHICLTGFKELDRHPVAEHANQSLLKV